MGQKVVPCVLENPIWAIPYTCGTIYTYWAEY